MKKKVECDFILIYNVNRNVSPGVKGLSKQMREEYK